MASDNITFEYDAMNDTLTMRGIDSHSFMHIHHALLALAGVLKSECIGILYNDIANAYNACLETIPEERLGTVEQQAEMIVLDHSFGIAFGVQMGDDGE